MSFVIFRGSGVSTPEDSPSSRKRTPTVDEEDDQPVSMPDFSKIYIQNAGKRRGGKSL